MSAVSNADHEGQILPLLLVEDHPLGVELVREALSGSSHPRYEISHAGRLDEALGLLRTRSFEVVLLDLGLPDSSGLKTLEAIRPAAPKIPIVVLTAMEAEETALAALARGADDYLYKGELDRLALRRSLRYSSERRQMLNRMVGARRREQLRRELRSLEQVEHLGHPPADAGPSSVASRVASFGTDEWHALVDRYGALIEAVASRPASIDDDPHVRALWDFAQTMGSHAALPSEAAEIHTEAMRRHVAGRTSDHAEPVLEAGREVLLRLIALLASYYRETSSRTDDG